MKKYILLLPAFVLAFIFSGCVGESLQDIDTFILSYNKVSARPIERADISAFSQDGNINYCFDIGEAFVVLCADENTAKIKYADIVTTENINEEYKSAVTLVLSSLTTLSDIEISSAVSSLVSSSDGYFSTREQVRDYTFAFTSADAGSKFTVSFNSLVPTQTTKTPVTQREFEEYETIEEFTG